MTLKSAEGGGTTIAQCDKYFLKKHTCFYPAFLQNILLLSRNSTFVVTFCKINMCISRNVLKKSLENILNIHKCLHPLIGLWQMK